jgi:hypothetical protein
LSERKHFVNNDGKYFMYSELEYGPFL